MENFAFDNNKYKELQKQEIYKRIQKYGKLYMEVGGKLFDDHHAARILPGFEPDVKMQIFKELSSDLEIIFCINARDIITEKVRNDTGLTYDKETLRLVSCLKNEGLDVSAIMINLYEPAKKVLEFEEACKEQNLKVYKSYFIDNYPNDIDHILSQDGFGRNDHIKTTKKIVLVSAPGANSGKLEVCLSQLYLDKLNGISSGYSKYETFPVWNLSLEHLVNIAYEMATADCQDKNMIDPFYKAAYNKIAVNYNRDIQAFPILSKILNQINGTEVYKSPTDMGINNVGNAIINDKEVARASMEEIERRYHKCLDDYKNHIASELTLKRCVELYERAKEIYKKI